LDKIFLIGIFSVATLVLIMPTLPDAKAATFQIEPIQDNFVNVGILNNAGDIIIDGGIDIFIY